jgi:leucyl aminopeptidase
VTSINPGQRVLPPFFLGSWLSRIESLFQIQKKKSSNDFEKLKFTQGNLVASLFKKVEAKNLSEWVRQLSSFQNRHCKSTSGKNASLFIQEQMKTLSKNNPAIKSELFAHSRFTQSSVITRWEGTGTDAKKTIVVGAHLDSINHVDSESFETKSAPGADDDASGVATVLEAFKILVDSGYQPKHSFEFMMYAGEEIGLVGSQDIAQNYSQKNKDVVSALQMDMTMYPADESKISIYTDYTHLGFNHYLGKMIDQYIKVPYVYELCGYACSDHASWDRYGYPSAFPFEVPYQKDNPFVHSSQDTLDRLNPDFGTHFLKLTLAYLVELDQGI